MSREVPMGDLHHKVSQLEAPDPAVKVPEKSFGDDEREDEIT